MAEKGIHVYNYKFKVKMMKLQTESCVSHNVLKTITPPPVVLRGLL